MYKFTESTIKPTKTHKRKLFLYIKNSEDFIPQDMCIVEIKFKS